MARYRGRHRKPTRTGRNLAAVSTSGAFLAAGITTGSGQEAHAATAWDVIAECESGNRNVENGSSSASGYFQIIDGTWRANGGLEFASRAINATKTEQLIVAQRIAANRGSLADWNASKGCWGDQIPSSVPPAGTTSSVPQPQRPAPAPTPDPSAAPGVVGQRAADGSGQYRCAADKLHFEACDPDNLGDLVNYPRYNNAAPVAAKPKQAKPDSAELADTVEPAATGKPAAGGQVAAPAGGNAVTAAAKNLLGVPYVWGGVSTSGVDCSGLVNVALRAAGHEPPRTAAALQDWATPVPQSQARAGDLFFWSSGGSTATHTGIYLGGGKLIEASQPGTVVSIRDVYSGLTFGRIPS